MSEAELLLAVNGSGGDAPNVVAFSCPTCGLRNFQPLDERGTRLLTSAGVRVVLNPDPAP
jgi:hypothetical protein